MTPAELVECSNLVFDHWPKEKPELVKTFTARVATLDKATVIKAIREAFPFTGSDRFCPWPALYSRFPSLPQPARQAEATHDNTAEILAHRQEQDAKRQAAIDAWAKLDTAARTRLIEEETIGWGEQLKAIELRFINRECPSRTVWGRLLGEGA
jgi:hypothetical protein